MKSFTAVSLSNKFFSAIEKMVTEKKCRSYSTHIPVVSAQQIEKMPLHCFYSDYKKLGGSSLPREVLNMAIQQIIAPQKFSSTRSIKLAVFQSIAEQILKMGITNQKEVWRIACIYTQIEFGYKFSYFKWQYFSHWQNKC